MLDALSSIFFAVGFLSFAATVISLIVLLVKKLAKKDTKKAKNISLYIYCVCFLCIVGFIATIMMNSEPTANDETVTETEQTEIIEEATDTTTKKQSTTSKKTTKATTTEEPYIPPTLPKEPEPDFKEIYKAYQKNSLTAEDKYEGNRYEITAKVYEMDTDGLFNLTGGAILTMKTSVGNTIVFFYAEFERDEEDWLRTIEVGDTITFEGTCSNWSYWTDCEHT